MEKELTINETQLHLLNSDKEAVATLSTVSDTEADCESIKITRNHSYEADLSEDELSALEKDLAECCEKANIELEKISKLKHLKLALECTKLLIDVHHIVAPPGSILRVHKDLFPIDTLMSFPIPPQSKADEDEAIKEE